MRIGNFTLYNFLLTASGCCTFAYGCRYANVNTNDVKPIQKLNHFVHNFQIKFSIIYTIHIDKFSLVFSFYFSFIFGDVVHVLLSKYSGNKNTPASGRQFVNN